MNDPPPRDGRWSLASSARTLEPLFVTGATGWIGRRLVARVREHGGRPWTAGRTNTLDGLPAGMEGGVMMHLAGLAHRETGASTPEEHFAANCTEPIRMARLAAAHGVRRFVFLSTAAVMPASSRGPWLEIDRPCPTDAYTRAKLKAEMGLATLADPGRFDVVVLRPPLVWGPGVRANFLRLLDLAAGPWPLPLGRATAPRSMIHIDSLVDALIHAGSSSRIGSGVWFVADEPDRSVADWIALLRAAQGRAAGLFPVPNRVAGALASLAGRSGLHARLFEPMQVDAAAFRATGWQPRRPFEGALRETLDWHAARAAVPAMAPERG